AYDEFARRLAHDLELEPAAETRALADAIRARLERAPARAAGAARGFDHAAAWISAASTSGDSATLADSATSGSSPTSGAHPTSVATIAVLPFAVRGDARLAYLGEGMVDLLATKLDGAGDIRTVDPRALLRALEHERGRTGSAGPGAGGGVRGVADSGAEIARRFGAGRYLSGTVVEAGGRLSVSAALYGLDGTAVASVEAAAAGEGDLF